MLNSEGGALLDENLVQEAPKVLDRLLLHWIVAVVVDQVAWQPQPQRQLQLVPFGHLGVLELAVEVDIVGIVVVVQCQGFLQKQQQC